MLITTDLNLKALPDWQIDLLLTELKAELLRRNPPKLPLPPLSNDEMRMVQFDMMIPAIKSYRARNESEHRKYGLKETKDLCDIHRDLCVRNGTFVPRERDPNQ